MFELFIALFGGAFYAGKYINEKSKEKDYKLQQLSRDATYETIQTRYVASFETERLAKEFISSGKHFKDICEWFKDDFRYVFGDNWKDRLQIPTPYISMIRIYGKKNYPWLIPSAHVMWVYHLMLAKQGKIDHGVLEYGYPIGGINEKDMSVKFAECIEKRLINSGVQDIRFALELDMKSSVAQRSASDLCGGHIKIESLCIYPSHRLWGK